MTPTSARDYITSMTTRPFNQTHPYAPNDIYDMGQDMLRELLLTDGSENTIDIDYYIAEYDNQPHIKIYISTISQQLHLAYTTLINDDYSRHFISELCLQYSVCPMHHDDYAACFDDDPEECRTIRQYFPNCDS